MHRMLVFAVVCFIAALTCGVTNAAVTTTGSAARSIPKKKEEEELPNFVVRPFDSAIFEWGFRYDNATKTERFVGTFNFTLDQWYAVGFDSNKRMNGPIASCWIAIPANGTIECADSVGEDYGMPSPARERLTEPVAAGASAGANFIQFETIIAWNVTQLPNSTALDYTYANWTVMHPNGFRRTIFATGEWRDSGRQQWKQHHVDNSYAVSINWRTGEKEKLNSRLFLIVFYELAAISVGVIIVSFLERHPPGPRSPFRRRLFTILCCVLYLALLVQYVAFRYMDYIKNVVGKAHVRCFGDGAVFCLGTMALPVSKKILFSTFFLCSHERAIKYHMFVGVLLCVFTVVHGIGMTYYYGSDGVMRMKDKDHQSRLPGVLCAIMIFFVMVPALLRHYFWRTFRLLHYTYALVFGLAVLHYPYTGVALAPGALLHLCAFATRRFVMSHLVGDNLDRCSYDKESGVVSMDFVRSDCIPAGSWFTVCFPEVSQFEQHPFSACRLLLVNGGKTTVVRFIAKVSDDPKSWTNRVAKRIEEVQEKEPDNIPVFKSYRLYGPYGVLQVNPKTYRHLLFVAGGMGITPHLLMLQQVLINDTHSMGPTGDRVSVTLMWSVRQPAEMEVFIHDLNALKTKLTATYPNLIVNFRVFCTVPDTPEGKAQIAPNPYVQTMGITVHKRPNFGEELDALVAKWGPEVKKRMEKEKASLSTMKDVDGKKAAPRVDLGVLNYSVATYVSGPKEFTNAAEAALGNARGDFNFHVHTEAFRL